MFVTILQLEIPLKVCSEVKLVFMFLLFHFISAGLQDLTWIGIDATPGARKLLTQIQNSLRFIGSAGQALCLWCRGHGN